LKRTSTRATRKSPSRSPGKDLDVWIATGGAASASASAGISIGGSAAAAGLSLG